MRDSLARVALGAAANSDNAEETQMLYYAAVFFVIALVAGLFGFAGIAAGASGIAQILFFVFLVGFIVSLVWGLVQRSR